MTTTEPTKQNVTEHARRIHAETLKEFCAQIEKPPAQDREKLLKLAAGIRALTFISIDNKPIQGLVATQGEKFALLIEKQAEAL